jgi:phosphoglycerate dehydrogenase-like enzyme
MTAAVDAPVRVAVLDDYQNVALSFADWTLGGRAEVTVFDDHLFEEDALVARLAPFAVVAAMRERTAFPESVLARLPNLKLLITTGPFNAVIDVAAAVKHGITVCGTGGAGVSTPELTWALILAVTRGIAAEDAAVRAGKWQLGVGTELAGSTLGVLGMGRIGPRISRYAKAFDMSVLAWSQNLTREKAAAAGARYVSKEELFSRSDIVTVHLKLSERTTGLVGAAELEALGPRGYLVNTSRGPIVDEKALVAALNSRTIAGAALDAYDVEPLPAGHPLLTAPNTVLSPHLGYVSSTQYKVFFSDIVEDIAAWLDGAPIRVIEP